MSAFVKSKLKAARDAIGKKDWENARQASEGVLEYEPANYNANVFLALALLNLGDIGQSEQVYRKAIAASPEQPLAWQGLSKLYEQSQNWEKYVETLGHIAGLFAKANDAVKTAETVQRIIELRRDPHKGSSLQLADALSLLLPESPFFSTLSQLPPPDPTNPTATSTYVAQSVVHDSLPILEELIAIHEQEEETYVQKEVAKRRTRLSAGTPEEFQKEVGREVLSSSKLPHLYNEVLNHPNTSDELRRETESKLLRHKQRYLHVLSTSGDEATRKAEIAAELEELINGMVLLGIRDELAWSIYIEHKDVAEIKQYGYDILKKYYRLFPALPLAKVIQGHFGYDGVSLSENDDESSEEEGEQEEEGQEAYVDMIIDAFASLPDSIFAHQVAADMYAREEDFENAIKISESGLELVKRAEQNWGKPMPQVRKAFNVILATSLVHYFPPKHHSRALGIIDKVLEQDPENIPCLMGRGYIMQFARKWDEARKLFRKVADLIPDDLDTGLRAKEEAAWCQVNMDELDSGAAALQAVLDVLDGLEDRSTDKARCRWRLGKSYWEMGDDYREEAYKHFITSLKRSPSFAPAFTSLGIYYAEFASPPDPNRASKCFQKAFELDPREAEAARRLAEGFAEEQEWDLVEVVARRTIDGEGGLEGGANAAPASRYLPLNSWAWKAVGVVELIRRNYAPAIQAFQIALRADTEDHLSWLRLGEAYSKAGRHAAALKALARAQELDPEDWIASYFIGDVERQMGEFTSAIKAFESILSKHPSELVVLFSLAQAYLDLGRSELATAYTARAEASFVTSIEVALRLMDTSPGYRRVAWKTVADAVFHLSQFPSLVDEDNVRDILRKIIPLVSDHPEKGLSGILTFPMLLDKSSNLSIFTLEVALAAYDHRISLGALDDAALGSAHFDLGVALLLYARAQLPGPKRERAQEEAVSHIKEALRLEPYNERYWAALGNATFVTHSRVAQHAYVRALELNSKDTVVWTNLGLFYLHHEDAELANEAFYKAQVLDPDYALAWVGQGLVATINGHEPEARALFEHAVGLSGAVPDADVEFAKRLFRQLNMPTQTRMPTSDMLFPAFFVLGRFCKQRPQDASALHLFALVCERIGHVELALDCTGRAIALLEAAYEDTEDPVIERQFTIAHTSLARLRLSVGNYEGALESLEVAMGLLPEVPEDDETTVLLTQAQFGSGLAHFKLGSLEEALSHFEAAMSTSAADPVMHSHVVVMLAQTLWAIGTEEGRESAKNQLLQSIDSNPENLVAINTLAGMGILTDDDSLVDAALSEILALPLDQRHERDPNREVTYLLTQHHLAQDDAARALSVTQKAVFSEPTQLGVRRQLATLTLQQRRSNAALAVLAGAAEECSLVDLRESLRLRAVAECLDKRQGAQGAKNARRLAQKAVLLAPWEVRNWQTLAFVGSCSDE
ncbi:TPR-like protein [Obba rivulosa]|uniref:TPR-like protein n=1 Tax=Obba rivulosa TaxID=1052685 RepID=A0A8E2AWD9_9APHY|nr:TPR-like protein [Obba rivulosa]